MRRSINARFFFLSLAAVAIVVAALGLVHAFQTHRIAAALLDQADRQRDAGAREEAITYLNRYLEFRPDDVDRMAQLGELLRQRSSGLAQPSLAKLYEQILRLEPGRDDVRRQLVDVYLSLPRGAAEAGRHLELLLQSAPDDADLLYKMGLCHEATARYAEAKQAYEQALQRSPKLTRAADALARLLHRQFNATQEALERLDALVASSPGDSEAYLARAQFRRDFIIGKAGNAATEEAAKNAVIKDADEALRLAPNNARALLLAAEVAQTTGNVPRARELYREGMRQHPHDPRMVRGLSWLEHCVGNDEASIAALRQGCETIPEDPDFPTTLAELLLKAGQEEKVVLILKKLETRKGAADRVEYLQALLAMSRGQWATAADLLERLRSASVALPALSVRVNLLLADCYERLGHADQQADAVQRALRTDPDSLQGKLVEARLLTAQGRLDEAMLAYRNLLKSSAPPASAALELARLATARIRLYDRPKSKEDLERRCGEVEALLKQADHLAPTATDKADAAVLAAELQLARGKKKEALAALEADCRDEKLKGQAHVWTARAELVLVNQGAPAALKVLTEAEAACGDRIDLRLWRAEVWSRGPAAEALRQLPTLEQNTAPFPPADLARLHQGLGDTYFRLNDLASAERLFRQAGREQPMDLALLTRLFEVAHRRSDAAQLDALIAEVAKVEGPGGTWRPFLEARRIVEAPPGKPVDVAKARALLGPVVQKRPKWAAAYRLLGQACERDNDRDGAASYYRQAVGLGDTEPAVFQGLLRVLLAAGKISQAEQVLGNIRAMTLLDTDRRLAIYKAIIPQLAAWPGGKPLNELLLKDVRDSREAILVGRLLWSAGKQDEATAAFRTATQLGASPEAFSHLLKAMTRDGASPDEMKRAEEMARRNLSPADLHQVRGEQLEAAHDYAGALKELQQSLTAKPGAIALRKHIIRLQIAAGRRDEALTALRAIYEKQTPTDTETVAWARRLAALSINSGHRPADFRAADELLAANRKEFGDRAEDRRAQAAALLARSHYLPAAKGKAARAESAKILEELLRQPDANRQDRFTLAQVYEQNDLWDKAEPLVRELLKSDPTNLVILNYLVEQLLLRQQWDNARPWLEQMARVAPTDERTLRGKARLLLRTNADEEALALLAGWRDGLDPTAKTFPIEAAHFCDLVKQFLVESPHAPAATRAALRRLAVPLALKCINQKADVLTAAAALLAQDTDAGPALDLLESSRVGLPTGLFLSAQVEALRASNEPTRYFDRVNRWLQTARKTDVRNALLYRLLEGELLSVVGRDEQAIALYRDVLQKEPNNVYALNNLAWLLAHRPENAKEALALIDKALAARGHVGELLDTRARVYLTLGDADAAIHDLEEAINLQPSAMRYFHLAMAHQREDNPEAAHLALRLAEDRGLSPRSLHSSDRKAYDQMVKGTEK